MKVTREVLFNAVFWELYCLYQWLGLASLYGHYHDYFLNACMALPDSPIHDLRIAPLPLLPLVENSFTHGVARSTGFRSIFHGSPVNFRLRSPTVKKKKA